MNIKKVVIIVISIFILVVISVAIFFFMQSKQLNEVRPVDEVEQIVVDDLIVDQLKQLPPPNTEVVNDEANYILGLKQLAFTFAERFGTYSSDDNFNSWRELDKLVTSRMNDYISDLIVSSAYNPDIFESYSTRALSGKIKNINSAKNRAVVLVKTQRLHTVDDKSELYYQDILIDFILTDDQWKVDGARWQS